MLKLATQLPVYSPLEEKISSEALDMHTVVYRAVMSTAFYVCSRGGGE